MREDSQHEQFGGLGLDPSRVRHPGVVPAKARTSRERKCPKQALKQVTAVPSGRNWCPTSLASLRDTRPIQLAWSQMVLFEGSMAKAEPKGRRIE
jgi:hypothetical protein